MYITKIILVNQSLKFSLAVCLFELLWNDTVGDTICCRYIRLAVYLFVWNEGCESVGYRMGCWVGRGSGLEGYTWICEWMFLFDWFSPIFINLPNLLQRAHMIAASALIWGPDVFLQRLINMLLDLSLSIFLAVWLCF